MAACCVHVSDWLAGVPLGGGGSSGSGCDQTARVLRVLAWCRAGNATYLQVTYPTLHGGSRFTI